MKRKLFAIVGAFMTVFMFSNFSVTAKDVQSFMLLNEVQPYLSYISDASSSLSISGNTAYVTADLIGQSGVTKCSVKVELQKKNGNSWQTVKSDQATTYGQDGYWSFDFPVTSGQTYRAKVTFTAYKGSKSEEATDLTNVETA